MRYVIEGATYDRLEAKCDRYREALIEADRALAAVVRYFDGQLPPAGFPLASTIKPAAKKAREALDDAAAPCNERPTAETAPLGEDGPDA